VCNSHKKCRTRAYRFGGGIRPSLRSGFTAYNALSLATGLLATIIREKHLASRELDTSTGVSEPHDFTVRSARARLLRLASTASHRTFVTIALAPLIG
jgi:hypothetical protein